MSVWSFFSNYGHVLLALAEQPDARMRDLAQRVGITERAIHRILSEMEGAGMISRERVGRRNHYSICRDRRLRHPIESHRTVGELVDLIWEDPARPCSNGTPDAEGIPPDSAPPDSASSTPTAD